jgi:hypothetical protein
MFQANQKKEEAKKRVMRLKKSRNLLLKCFDVPVHQNKNFEANATALACNVINLLNKDTFKYLKVLCNEPTALHLPV